MEQFDFDIRKMKFSSQEPGKETRRNLIIILIFTLLLVGILCFTLKGAALSVLIPSAGKKVWDFIKQLRGGNGP